MCDPTLLFMRWLRDDCDLTLLGSKKSDIPDLIFCILISLLNALCIVILIFLVELLFEPDKYFFLRVICLHYSLDFLVRYLPVQVGFPTTGEKLFYSLESGVTKVRPN